MTKEIGVGKETLSYCSKCKLTLSHIIAAMKDLDTIAKVFCKTCKATHAYKDPNKASKKKVVSHRRKTEMAGFKGFSFTLFESSINFIVILESSSVLIVSFRPIVVLALFQLLTSLVLSKLQELTQSQ